jgi:hypothetical protein
MGNWNAEANIDLMDVVQRHKYQSHAEYLVKNPSQPMLRLDVGKKCERVVQEVADAARR